ncbi:zwei Ig domain protein zig-8 [Eurytemora carolleeae]|uniref:zwei Ig domain protein zig-8 n=1 Tax=Eurytemora carolleeae TaxID=1294199 RepID=UPI000C773FCF|nr:zwei Ig domain protein zig-8 [Eurytemora carolleeae]|eukprot:XP_023332482.1 zwei Ig domain protein zig-8-like [Eurytemora affinis]
MLLQSNCNPSTIILHFILYFGVRIPELVDGYRSPVQSIPGAQILLPRFSEKSHATVEVQVGMDAKLHCWVENVSQNAVTWIRQNDLQILSAGSLKFSADPRIQIKHDSSVLNSDDYILEISRVGRQDQGLYECQINMRPLKAFIVKLIVKDIPPSTEVESTQPSPILPGLEVQDTGSSTSILGAPDIYFHPGTLVNLTCLVSSSTDPGRIFWYHEDKVISYYSSRLGVSIYRNKQTSMLTVSSLLLREGRKEDEGTYICRPEKAFMKSGKARLFIVDGTRSEARKTSGANPISLFYILLLFSLSSIFIP